MPTPDCVCFLLFCSSNCSLLPIVKPGFLKQSIFVNFVFRNTNYPEAIVLYIDYLMMLFGTQLYGFMQNRLIQNEFYSFVV